MKYLQYGFATLMLCLGVAFTQQATINANYDNIVMPFLTTADQQTIYMFQDDKAGESSCADACAEAWPPVLTDGEPQAGDGVDAGMLGTTTRADGTTQVTYNGMPLYTFAQDSAPGDKNGEGLKGAWFLISPYGDTLTPQVAKKPTTAPGGNAMEDAMVSQEDLMQAGEGAYNANCARCHGVQGEGGTGPVLADNPKLDDSELILRQVIKGGRIMPPFGNDLSDKDIAAVSTFIRNTWNNDFGIISPQDVQSNR